MHIQFHLKCGICHHAIILFVCMQCKKLKNGDYPYFQVRMCR